MYCYKNLTKMMIVSKDASTLESVSLKVLGTSGTDNISKIGEGDFEFNIKLPRAQCLFGWWKGSCRLGPDNVICSKGH